MADPIGQRLRQARLDYGMSQVELARRCGLSRQNLNNIERLRSKPSVALIRKIARVLRVSSDYLLELGSETDIPAWRCRGVMG